MDTVGDLARTLVLRTHQTRLNRSLDTLATEIATGFVNDTASHLGGDVTGLLAIDRSLARLETYRVATTEAAFLTNTMQTTLGEMQSRSESLSQVLLSADLTPSPEMLRTLSEEARNTLDQVTNALNRSIAGRFLFSGTATDSPAIADSETLLNELRTVVAGQTDAAGVDAALDNWFDAAGGGFETVAYLGSDTGLAPLQLSQTETANVDIRADDQVFRDMLKASAKAALATDAGLGFDDNVQVELLNGAGRDLVFSQAAMVELRAGLGALEARIEETGTRNAAERTANMIARVELVGTDEFETATKYENTRSQLEALYAITVRSSRMSLVEYL